MARLSRKTPEVGSERTRNPTLAVGLALALGVGILLFIFVTSLASKTEVLVAKNNIPPYSVITPNLLDREEVPSESVDETRDLTSQDLDNLSPSQKLVTRVEILPRQRIHREAVSQSATGTLSVVKPTEKVIAVSTTYPGLVGGAVVPGSVVDVLSSSGANATGEKSSGALASNVKVLGVGTGAGGAASSLRPGAGSAEEKGSSEADQQEASEQSGANIVVVLAVPENTSASIAGSNDVVLALNPRQTYDINGNVCDIGRCQNPTAQQSAGQAGQSGENPAAPEAGQSGENPAAPEAEQSGENPAAPAPGGTEELPDSPTTPGR